jgi:(1->4)-alpha-D-glucan 1-alpha-D-glucosylmutase
VGLWPSDRSELTAISERLQAYITKAIREAMVHTRWTEPNAAYEQAVCSFVKQILSPQDNPNFLCSVSRFVEKVAYAGMTNGLGQTLLRIACPGVPDFYQGSELWDRHLVDPDNRGAVDFFSRTRALQELMDRTHAETAAIAGELLTQWPDGRIKLYAIWKALGCRRRHPALFREGEFLPLEIVGERAQNIISFMRRRGDEQAIIVIPRWVVSISDSPPNSKPGGEKERGSVGFWKGTNLRLPPGSPASWCNIFTAKTVDASHGDDRHIAAGDLLKDFPVAMLVSMASSTARI